ncbi:hypothetical protein LIER_41811 [Lithospermum erythrorhizon]|uniref:IBB domain-containing protein n=1 Tax=Lithospermum erythrorhizon TaxID=34254 RepID=A0AAV3RET4_LITER
MFKSSLKQGVRTRSSTRRRRYKVAVDVDEGRRRRKNNLIEIQKNKRKESLWMKRREMLQINLIESKKGSNIIFPKSGKKRKKDSSLEGLGIQQLVKRRKVIDHNAKEESIASEMEASLSTRSKGQTRDDDQYNRKWTDSGYKNLNFDPLSSTSKKWRRIRKFDLIKSNSGNQGSRNKIGNLYCSSYITSNISSHYNHLVTLVHTI